MATAVIDCDFDSWAGFQGGTTYVEDTTATTVRLRMETAPDSSNTLRRGQLRFSLATVTAGSTITDSDLQVNVGTETVEVSEDVNVHAYNNTGDDDPASDNAQTKYSRSIGGSALVQITGDATGSTTADLTATADAQIQGNISSPGFYSLGLANDAEWDDGEVWEIESTEAVGTDPATLTVVYKFAAVTGTVTPSATEAEIVAGGQTIIITLDGDAWIAAGAGSFDLQRDEILQGLDSAQSEALGWNLQVRDTELVTAVVRTSDTVVTITLNASVLYDITAQETITVTVPSTAVVGAAALTATPTFTVETVAGGGATHPGWFGGRGGWF